MCDQKSFWSIGDPLDSITSIEEFYQGYPINLLC